MHDKYYCGGGKGQSL